MTPESYVAQLACQLNAGHYHLIAERFSLPMPIFIGKSTAVATTGSDVWGFLQGLHALIRASGHLDVTARLISVELPQRNRFRLWTDWTGEGPGGSRPLFRSICYNNGAIGQHKTEMIRFEDLGWPQLARMARAA